MTRRHLTSRQKYDACPALTFSAFSLDNGGLALPLKADLLGVAADAAAVAAAAVDAAVDATVHPQLTGLGPGPLLDQ